MLQLAHPFLFNTISKIMASIPPAPFSTKYSPIYQHLLCSDTYLVWMCKHLF